MNVLQDIQSHLNYCIFLSDFSFSLEPQEVLLTSEYTKQENDFLASGSLACDYYFEFGDSSLAFTTR